MEAVETLGHVQGAFIEQRGRISVMSVIVDVEAVKRVPREVRDAGLHLTQRHHANVEAESVVVEAQLSAVRATLKDKRVVVVDDSIVRGTTSRKIVKMLKACVARECTCASRTLPRCGPASLAVGNGNSSGLG